MKFIKRHKGLIVALIVFILVFILFIMAYKFFFPDEEKANYGDRLDGIEKVELTKADKDKIIDSQKEISKSTTVRVQGRIIEVNISLNDSANRDQAKESAKKIPESLSEGQKGYYDIQIFVKKEAETEDKAQFPIIGYKHHTLADITWTKDR